MPGWVCLSGSEVLRLVGTGLCTRCCIHRLPGPRDLQLLEPSHRMPLPVSLGVGMVTSGGHGAYGKHTGPGSHAV